MKISKNQYTLLKIDDFIIGLGVFTGTTFRCGKITKFGRNDYSLVAIKNERSNLEIAVDNTEFIFRGIR
jgi:hypothetical protein